jgi:hypothetical protein
MNYAIIALALFDGAIVAVWIRDKARNRVKYHIKIHMLNGEQIVWDSRMNWPETMRHLPPCMSQIGNDRVTAYEISPQ